MAVCVGMRGEKVCFAFVTNMYRPSYRIVDLLFIYVSFIFIYTFMLHLSLWAHLFSYTGRMVPVVCATVIWENNISLIRLTLFDMKFVASANGKLYGS